MKTLRILFGIVLIALSLSVSAQDPRFTSKAAKDWAALVNDSLDNYSADILSTIDSTAAQRAAIILNIARLNTDSNRIDIASTQLQDSLGWFYITSSYGGIPGAISGDGNPDQAAFQAARNAAAADRDRGGTVIVPNGTYNFTGPDTLKSYTTIRFDKNARINVAADYSGSIFYSGDGALTDAWIIGGYYYGDGNDWTFLDVVKDGEGNYASSCHVKDVRVRNGNTGINFYTDDSGWINAFSFSDSWFMNQKSFLKTRDPNATGLGIDGHFFNSVYYQTSDSTEIVLDSITGDYNSFVNFFVWDISTEPSASTGVFNSTAYYNRVIAGEFSPQNFSDNGFYNYVQRRGNQLLTPIADSARVHEDAYATGNTYNNRLILSRDGAGGSDGSPGGDNAIKLYAGGTPTPKVATGSNYSARILVQNESGSNRSSHLTLQVHESANANGEDNYIDALYLDGSAGGDATFSQNITVPGIATFGNSATIANTETDTIFITETVTKITGSLYVTGTIEEPHGGGLTAVTTPGTMTIATGGTFERLNEGAIAYTAYHLENFTHSDGRLTYTGTPNIHISLYVTIGAESGETAQRLQFELAKGGSVIAATNMPVDFTAQTIDRTVTLLWQDEIATNEYFEVFGTSDTNGDVFDVKNLVFSIEKH